jgi:uncharacterized protein (DUF885 family)
VLGRLVPWYGTARHAIQPGWRPSKLYPDKGLRSLAEREAGVWPVTVDRDQAMRMRLAERGMDNAVQKLDDKTKTIERMKTFGLKPTDEFNSVYDQQIERMRRIAPLKRSYRGLGFQRRAMKSDLDYYVKLGKITEKQRDATVTETDDLITHGNEAAALRQIQSWRTNMAKHFLDPDNVVGGVKDYLTGLENAQRK